MTKVWNYDDQNYDYSKYWEKRDYENLAEQNILKKIFQKNHGYWFIDIGGSFGRLLPTYYDSFKKPLIVDYSLKTLQKNRKSIKEKFPNTELIAANAYKLPFRANTFDGGCMVRVLHHIEDPETYFKEIYRVFRDDGTYVQEFANKIHIKAGMKALLKKDYSFFNKEPYQQPTQNNFEGAKKGSSVAFLNFHPEYIEDLLEKTGFEIEEKQGCSYLRSQKLKNFLSEKALFNIEKLFQKILKTSNIPPSIFFETEVEKDEKNINFKPELKDILICPNCKSELDLFENKAVCYNCKQEYLKDDEVWDFRIQ